MATQVTIDDGTELPLLDHLRDAHHKGTRGLTEEYLSNLHRTLHQRTRDDMEHIHRDEDAEGDAPVSQR
jgi:hypothetical protein